MKTGRNEPCPCGSGKKYKHCCISNHEEPLADIMDEFEQIAITNPHLSLEDLNTVIEHKIAERNKRPNADFCGLSATQMSNWLYAPFSQLELVKIKVPADLSMSPIMCYLAIILDEASQQGGSFKLTQKGSLPLKLVRQAAALETQFAIAQYSIHISLSDFMGNTEDQFNALHYARVIADIAGLTYLKKGSLCVKKTVLKQYHASGLGAFFLPMLEAAIYHYNWAYLDGHESEVPINVCRVFMVWRLQVHASPARMINEVHAAFPHLEALCAGHRYNSPKEQLEQLIMLRFVERFLEYWGFVTVDPKSSPFAQSLPSTVDIQPLLTQTFQFEI